MSQKNGRLVTCDRCGASVFLECIGEGETDGGYTRWNEFEPLPDGWGMEFRIMLCPECFSIVRNFADEFTKPVAKETLHV